MKIEAYLKKDEKGCNYSKYFYDKFIKNEKLHPKVKAITIKFNWYNNIKEPEIRVLKDGVEILNQKGNQINAATLQEFILKNV